MNRRLLLRSLLILLFHVEIFCEYLGRLTVVTDEQRLHSMLLHSHKWKVVPVRRYRDRLYVYLRFKLERVFELEVKDQLLTLHLKMELEWQHYVRWDPDLYGGISQITFPAESIWLPDVELYNKFGDFEMEGSSVVIHSNGLIKWKPSAITKTFCSIEVRYYPFDIQTCFLKFGSWLYDGNELYVTLKDLPAIGRGSGILPVGMVLTDYYPSAEWDLISIPAIFEEAYYPCCNNPYVWIGFNITLRRHYRFHLANLVMPLVGLSYLSLLVFYLPADSGEKITLCVSVLASQVMFLLLMIDNIPVTSLAVPLLGRIIVFNMILVFLSVLCTTIVLNVYYRKPTTHEMPRWAKHIRYSRLPRVLLMEEQQPQTPRKSENDHVESGKNDKPVNICDLEDTTDASDEDRISINIDLGSLKQKRVSRLCSLSIQEINDSLQRTSSLRVRRTESKIGKYSPKIYTALHNVNYVGNFMKRLEEENNESDDWKFLASLLDRIFLVIFNIIFFVGTAIIMMDAPALTDQREPVDKHAYIGNSVQFPRNPLQYLDTNYSSEFNDNVTFNDDK